MKRKLFLLVTAMFLLGSLLSAAEPTVKKPFNGTNLNGWKFNGGWENCWKNGGLKASATTFELVPLRGQWDIPCLLNMVDVDWIKEPRKGVDIYTEEKFGDCTVKLEFLITKGSNSGVYLMGEYEVQIQDSFAKPVKPIPDQENRVSTSLSQGDMGAIYSAAAPSVNASGVPGTWQTYEIEFVAPKFNAAGEKIANAVFKKVLLNGVLVQENVEVKGPTGGGVTGQEAPTGPLMFQGNHGPVAFRNIEVIVP